MSKEDHALMELYAHLQRRNAGSFDQLDADGRRAYFREAKRRSRTKAREQNAAGAPAPSTTNIRAALSDAALMILATGAPGADEIERVLAQVFTGKPGLPMVVRARAARGRLRPIIAKVKL